MSRLSEPGVRRRVYSYTAAIVFGISCTFRVRLFQLRLMTTSFEALDPSPLYPLVLLPAADLLTSQVDSKDST